MKIAVTAKGTRLDDRVDPRFGRCPFYVIVETRTMSAEALENPNRTLADGAGVRSARLMEESGVKAVLTGHCGPDAFEALDAAGIGVIVGAGGRIRDTMEQLRSGALAAETGPNVPSRFGLRGDDT